MARCRSSDVDDPNTYDYYKKSAESKSHETDTVFDEPILDTFDTRTKFSFLDVAVALQVRIEIG